MSLKRKSSTPSRSLKRISLTQTGKVKNSPIKEMNGLSLKELIKNDKKMDPKLRDDLNMITTTMESSEIKKQSFAKMKQQHYCHYLKTKVNRKTMKKLFEVLLLKHKYSEEKDMDKLCTILSKHRPDLMRPRVLNLILAVINIVFNKTAITIFLLVSGIFGMFYYNALTNGDFQFNPLHQQLVELLTPLGITSAKDISTLVGVTNAFCGATIYNILRQVSYFMPRGLRLGNRIRARHSARHLIGDTRRNNVIINV